MRDLRAVRTAERLDLAGSSTTSSPTTPPGSSSRPGPPVALGIEKGLEDRLPAHVAATAHRIVLEALTGIGKHAATATAVRVTPRTVPAGPEVRIADGGGHPATLSEARGGFLTAGPTPRAAGSSPPPSRSDGQAVSFGSCRPSPRCPAAWGLPRPAGPRGSIARRRVVLVLDVPGRARQRGEVRCRASRARQDPKETA
ncbi:hypothetical protein OG373_28670 [Streptomyces avidinii]|uniref:hypothetical protein n=1 Tax=Streptomyces avidinii TaxID=1895 RepID=UPI0038661F2E|nr:hypothetical protein OG373_28670 [Streptomyces avidinii]